jgi:hypothetical protein
MRFRVDIDGLTVECDSVEAVLELRAALSGAGPTVSRSAVARPSAPAADLPARQANQSVWDRSSVVTLRDGDGDGVPAAPKGGRLLLRAVLAQDEDLPALQAAKGMGVDGTAGLGRTCAKLRERAEAISSQLPPPVTYAEGEDGDMYVLCDPGFRQAAKGVKF